MMAIAEPNGEVEHVARMLIHELDALPRPASNARWQVTWIAWSVFLRMHLTHRERTTIFLTLAPNARGRRGFEATSRAMFGRSLRELDVAEVATVFALVRSASASGERLDRARDHLAAAYEAARVDVRDRRRGYW